MLGAKEELPSAKCCNDVFALWVASPVEQSSGKYLQYILKGTSVK
jgi:hypothetical protein